MCVILYNTCETGHIESSVLLSLSASCLKFCMKLPQVEDCHVSSLHVDGIVFTVAILDFNRK